MLMQYIHAIQCLLRGAYYRRDYGVQRSLVLDEGKFTECEQRQFGSTIYYSSTSQQYITVLHNNNVSTAQLAKMILTNSCVQVMCNYR